VEGGCLVLSVTIETAIFAPPPIDSSPDLVHRFIESLLEWKEAMDDQRLEVYMSKFAPDVLMSCGMYPMRPQLSAVLSQAGVYEYDANTVAVLAETILGRAATIEDAIGISYVLCNDVTLTPDVFVDRAPAELKEDANRCAIVLSVANRFANEPLLRGHAIAIRTADVGTAVQIRGLIEDIDHTRDDLGGLPLTPNYFEGSILACSTFHHFIMSLDETEILRTAADERTVAAVIRVAIYKRYVSRGSPSPWHDLPRFSLGTQFFSTLRQHQVMSGSGLAERVVRSIVETVCHDKLDATHALRVGKGANDPQRKRGDDLSWRRDVDHEYHLHYWECATGITELAALVVHNDFSIP